MCMNHRIRSIDLVNDRQEINNFELSLLMVSRPFLTLLTPVVNKFTITELHFSLREYS